jgi:queuosine precursor transporter
MHQLSDSAIRRLLIALAIYITSLVAANTLGAFKVMPFLFDSHLSIGVFMFPVVFLMTDVVGEVYGKKVARYFVFAGIISTLLFIAYNVVSMITPWAPEAIWAKESYEQIFGLSLRISIASIIAFAVAEYQDVVSFFFFKKRFAKGGFWLRSTLSNLWSQALDTVLFMVIAFYGVYETPVLISLIITWWLYKVAMGIVYTPLAYVGVKLLREKDASPSSTTP